MLSKHTAKNIIKETVRSSIVNFAKASLNKKRKFQILDLIIPKERKIRSIVGGFETSLGTTLWEPLAKSLASMNGFEIINSDLKCPTNMPSNLNNILQTIVDDRKSDNPTYNAIQSHNEIKRACQSFLSCPISDYSTAPRGFGVDIWLKKDGVNYFFDTKTVQPNVGTLTTCMIQVLNWYAYYYSKEPQGSAVARIVFPYNPDKESDFWDKVKGKGKPLERDNEGWVENQFWNFCSGLTDTYSIIVESFTELKDSDELEESINTLLEEVK